MKVPYVSNTDIDSAVIELLGKCATKLGRELLPPIPVDDIIEKFLGITLEIVDLQTRLGMVDVLGAAYFDENVIRVDENLLQLEGRLSFTMAHEIGHWQLHRPLYEMEKVTVGYIGTRVSVPDFVCRSGRKPPAEVQADRFAARLLMPERLVRIAFHTIHGEGPFLLAGLRNHQGDTSVVGPWSELAKAVLIQGNFSNVSIEAMRYRLDDLKLIRDKESTEAQPNLL